MFKKITRCAFFAFAAIALLSSFNSLQDWFSFESKEMGFKVKFPSKPSEQTQAAQTAVGNIKMHIALLDMSQDPSASNLIYGINYSIFPDSLNSDRKDKMDAFFTGSVNGMATRIKGTLTSQKIIGYKGFPGREAKIDLKGQATITARFILIHNKYYMLMVISAVGKDTNGDVTKFFESFESD